MMTGKTDTFAPGYHTQAKNSTRAYTTLCFATLKSVLSSHFDNEWHFVLPPSHINDGGNCYHVFSENTLNILKCHLSLLSLGMCICLSSRYFFKTNNTSYR